MDNMDWLYTSIEQEFHEKGVEVSEMKLIEIVNDAKSLWEVYRAAILLRKYGTPAAVPALQKAMYYPMQDIKITALGAIATICKGDGCHLYVSALQDPQYREKCAAVTAIYEYCDERGIEPVIARVKQMLSRKRRGIYYGPNQETEITYAITYLDKYSKSHDEILILFAQISHKWSFLWEHEQAYLKKHIGFFSKQ
jgi:hypothetical protein